VQTLQKILFNSIKNNKTKNAIWVDNKYYSYKRINELSENFKKIFSNNKSDSVCILSEKNIHCYAAILATILDGRVYVPLNPKFPVEKNKQILNFSESKILLVESKFIKQAKLIVGKDNKKKIFIVILDKNIESNNLKKNPFKITTSKSICYLLYTSGSTGKPKGVPINNMNLVNYLKNVSEKYRAGTKDKFSHNFDLTFDLSIHDIFFCWMSGSCLYVTPKKHLLNPGYFIRKHNLTMWFSVPSLGLNMLKMKQLKKKAFPSLKQTLFCGEALPQVLVKNWQKAAPNSKIDNLYGPTETTIAILSYRWNQKTSEKECVNEIVPIGTPFKKQKANFIIDKSLKKNTQPIGELCLSGTQIFKGYLKNKKDSNSKLFKDKDKRIWFKTGDLIKKNSLGNYIYLGRVDRQIKVRGFRVEVQEVENFLRKIIKSNYSAVVGWPLIENSNYSYSGMVAFILNETKMKNNTILENLKKKLPLYSIPQTIIRLKKFPLNSNGKIDYKKLLSKMKNET